MQELIRQLDDESLEELSGANQGGVGSWMFRDELARRAEIRINRVFDGTLSQAAVGEKHDASWYNSRQTEEQWLQEVGAE